VENVNERVKEIENCKLKLIACGKCWTVKTVLANTFGTSSWCGVCKDLTPCFDLGITTPLIRIKIVGRGKSEIQI